MNKDKDGRKSNKGHMQLPVDFAAKILIIVFLLSGNCASQDEKGQQVLGNENTADKKSRKKSQAPEPTSLKSKETIDPEKLQEEIDIGRPMAGKLIASKGVLGVTEATNYLNALAYILKASSLYPDRKFMVEILKDSTPNAFACPAGYIFVTSGLLKSVQSEAQLAFVLAHEISHVGKQHIFSALRGKKSDPKADSNPQSAEAPAMQSRKRVKPNSQSGLAGIVSQQLAGSGGLGMSLLQAVDGGLNIILLEGLDESMEFEADSEALDNIAAAGYMATAPIEFLQILDKQHSGQSKQNDVKGISKTHPTPKDRIQKLNMQIKNQHILTSQGATGVSRVKQLQAYIK